MCRLFPRPGEMAREVCPPEGEPRREASEEDDLDRMHLLDLWKMPPPEGADGGGDCGILGRTLHLGLREPPVLELEAVVPVHEAVPDDDLELNELRDHSKRTSAKCVDFFGHFLPPCLQIHATSLTKLLSTTKYMNVFQK